MEGRQAFKGRRVVFHVSFGGAGEERSRHSLRGSGTCGQDRLELPYAEKCLLEINVSDPIWAYDVQLHEAPWLYLTLLHSC